MPETLLDEEWTIEGVSLARFTHATRTMTGRRRTAPRRGENAQFPYYRGRRWRRKLPEQKTITILCWVDDADEDGSYAATGTERLAQFNANLREIEELFNVHTREIEMTRRIRTEAGLLELTGRGEAADTIGAEYSDDALGFADLAIDVVMADPYWYGAETAASVPSAGATVEHPGSAERADHLLLRFHGPLANPTLTNETLGQWVKVGANIGTGEWIELDVGEGLATNSDSENVIGTVTHSGAHAWLELARGDNELTLDDASGGLVVVTFSPPYDL